jgi:hypothetical protein
MQFTVGLKVDGKADHTESCPSPQLRRRLLKLRPRWICVVRPPRRAAPILRGSRPGSSDLPTAQRFPLAAGEEACATCDRASNHVRLPRFTVRERCIPGLGESVGLV